MNHYPRSRHKENQNSTQTNTTETNTEQTERTCSECKDSNIIFDETHGEYHCEQCGLIVEDDTIDHGPEWRSFNTGDGKSRSRVGAPVSQKRHDKGLTTTIDWRNRDANNNQLNAEKRAQMSRLRTWQQRIRTKDNKERNLKLAFNEIERMGSALGLPENVQTMASVIYRKALAKNTIRGRSIEAVASASLYAACRQENIPRSLEEITNVARVERKDIGRTYRHISQLLNLELEPVDPTQYIPRFNSKLDLPPEVERIANEIITDSMNEGLLSGKSPTGFAAAGIYLASLLYDEPRTQEEVAEATNVTEVTIRNRYKEQLKVIENQHTA